MHMNDALISLEVGIPLLAISGVAILASCKHIQRRSNKEPQLIVLMAVLGAFVFSIQMINFAIPGTGASGHMVGSMLLAIILGPVAGFVVISSVLIVQALFFADGGLLALGANIFNVGIIPCFIIYPLIWQPLAGDGNNKNRRVLAAIFAGILAMMIGSSGVAIMTHLSGVTLLPLFHFLLVIIPVHAVIGFVEGAVTAAILNAAWHSAEFKNSSFKRVETYSMHNGNKRNKFLLALILSTVVISSVVSLIASNKPDVLEWTVNKLDDRAAIDTLTMTPLKQWLGDLQQRSVFSDYGLTGDMSTFETAIIGVMGCLLTLAFIIGLLFLVKLIRRASSFG